MGKKTETKNDLENRWTFSFSRILPGTLTFYWEKKPMQ